jgi:chromosome segregation ATPase
MAETLEKDGNRIDRASQKILRELKEGGEWIRGLTLRRAADLSQNTQVFYRVEEHLLPAGLVEEAARTGQDGYVEPRRFRLTSEGEEWVESHAAALAEPATREEAREMAGEAYEAAESARESVQNYRKKLYRVRSRVEELEELPGRVGETETKLEYHAGSLEGIRSRAIETEEAHEEFAEEMREATERQHSEIEALQSENAELKQRLSRLEQSLDGLVRTQVKRRQDRWKVRDSLSARLSIVLLPLLLVVASLYFILTGQWFSVLVFGLVGSGCWFLGTFLYLDWLFPRRWTR